MFLELFMHFAMQARNYVGNNSSSKVIVMILSALLSLMDTTMYNIGSKLGFCLCTVMEVAGISMLGTPQTELRNW